MYEWSYYGRRDGWWWGRRLRGAARGFFLNDGPLRRFVPRGVGARDAPDGEDGGGEGGKGGVLGEAALHGGAVVGGGFAGDVVDEGEPVVFGIIGEGVVGGEEVAHAASGRMGRREGTTSRNWG